MINNWPPKTLKRATLYKYFFTQKLSQGEIQISSDDLSSQLHIRKDIVENDFKIILNLENVSHSINIVDALLAFDKVIKNTKIIPVIVVGVGRLGSALLNYSGFISSNIDIIAGFDTSRKICDRTSLKGKPVLHVDEINDFCQKTKTKIAILAVPAHHAKKMVKALTEAGIRVIWNLSSIDLSSSSDVYIRNENLTDILVQLTKRV